jgi:hypothetical protein
MRRLWILIIFVMSHSLFGCSSGAGPVSAIEGYIQSLTEKDVVAAVSASCLAWEEAAHAEASSFEAVEVTIDGLVCIEAGLDNEFTLVECDGKLVADYGGEIQDIDLSLRTYLAIREQGEWKMCGYASN